MKNLVIAACHLGSFIYLLMMPALCSQWVMGSKYRAKLRKKYGLVEAPYTDVISHVFCPCCSLCQEFRELKFRGLDPALGNSIALHVKVLSIKLFFQIYLATFLKTIKNILNSQEEKHNRQKIKIS